MGESWGALQDLVGQLGYKPGWSFRLVPGASFGSSCVQQEISVPGTGAVTTGNAGYAVLVPPLSLVVCVITEDSGGAGQISIEHRFAVPPPELVARPPWRRWLLDRILDVERHEACEFFAIGGERPFYPEHGPGARLYDITERPAS